LLILDPALLVLYQYLKNSHKKNRLADIKWPSKVQEQSFYLSILDSYMHRGCSLLATDIFDLLDFPDLSSISIEEAAIPGQEETARCDSLENPDAARSSGTVVSRNYDDLFSASPEMSSRPADLFDEYPKSTLKSEDFFSDYQNSTANDNIFDDYQAQEKSLSDIDEDNLQVESTKELKGSSEDLVRCFKLQDAIRIGFETRQLIVLKKCIIMRILAV
jgi:hypothetical protein